MCCSIQRSNITLAIKPGPHRWSDQEITRHFQSSYVYAFFNLGNIVTSLPFISRGNFKYLAGNLWLQLKLGRSNEQTPKIFTVILLKSFTQTFISQRPQSINVYFYPQKLNSMQRRIIKCFFLMLVFCGATVCHGQTSLKLKFKRSTIFAGIEVGSKGVKMSLVEIDKKAVRAGSFNLLKDTSVNTDFISFSESSFQATLQGLTALFDVANKKYQVPTERIFTLVSSGVRGQAEKDNRTDWIKKLSDSFRVRIGEPSRKLEAIDVKEEARLSHLGIVPESKRYSTFLVDIGSGNSKGGYFPSGNTSDMKLFLLNWGTKSVANAVEKRLEGDASIANFSKQLFRVLSGAANTDIEYAINVSGAYNMSDNVAFSGGIAWSVSTLLFPEMVDNSVVPVTYDEVQKLSERLVRNYNEFSADALVKKMKDNTVDRAAVTREIKDVNKVFDQRALMSGVGLLLKIMRQFEGIYEKKQFYLVKNGQVGWISAFVDESVMGK